VGDEELIRVGRREVRLTSPDKVLFPGDGVTKRDLADYYAEIGPALGPHLRDRPFTLKRYPYGIRGPRDSSAPGRARAVRGSSTSRS
jgi:bifunctional non-homologous end joining protein LigD